MNEQQQRERREAIERTRQREAQEEADALRKCQRSNATRHEIWYAPGGRNGRKPWDPA